MPTRAAQRDGGGRPLRMAFLTVMPSPYIQDMFDAMAADGRIEPRVYYLEVSAPDTHWQEPELPAYAQVLPGRWFNFLGGRIHRNPGAIRTIRADRPDVVVVGGYSALTTQAMMLSLRWSGMPWIFWGEMPGMRSRRGIASTLRWLAQRPAVRWPGGIAAIGSRAADIYRDMAPRDCLIENIPYCCDMRPMFDIPRAPARGRQVRFLYCGQLIERKGVDMLVGAFCQVAEQYDQITLTLVGEGPQREELAASIPPGLRSRVDFAGFHQIDELPKFFAAADAFVLPSRHDGWGVVVNQAVAAGLAVICSDAVGAAVDLVREDDNGFIVPAGDEARLAGAIRTLAADPTRIAALADNSRACAAEWTPERIVDRWARLGHGVLNKKSGVQQPGDYVSIGS